MPEIGHLDPVFVGLMSKIQQLLRHVWQTQNQMTIPVSNVLILREQKLTDVPDLENHLDLNLFAKLLLGQRNW